MTDHGRVPPREECVLRYLLERRAADHPERTFVVFDGGEEWSYGELLRRVRGTAAGLQAAGVGQGDHVLCWLPNGPDALRLWFAINYVGAVYVPINTAYRGGVLRHVVANAGARLMVADHRLVERLADVDLGADVELDTVAAVGGPAAPVPGLRIVDAATLVATGEPAPPERPIEPWDTQAILYTSGTTGPSKGVVSSYMQAYAMFGPTTMEMLGAEDRYLINMPMFHVGGATLLYAMLVHGGSVALVEAFSSSRFWTQIRDTDATVVFLLGVMASFVESLPPDPADADNPLRKVFMVPLLRDVAGFAARFDVDVYTIYNMTELSAPIVGGPNPTVPDSCGRVRDGVQIRLVDEHDNEVPVGEVGEIVVRTDAPWALATEYYRMPEATAKAWRNGWFHTGDTARRDADGNVFFVDRLKDALRRRGENISSMEVETEIAAHPDVREVAVIGVPSEVAEDEVLAIVAPAPGRTIDPVDLVEFLRPRLAYYMVPRYVRVVDELPKTPTAKVQKHLLRDEGLTAGTWDREAAGVVVARERLGRPA
jgi:carnitine-CoA ligase